MTQLKLTPIAKAVEDIKGIIIPNPKTDYLRDRNEALEDAIDILESLKEYEAEERNEAISIIETLMQYGNIHTITRVIYPAGTHKEFLDKASRWLHENRTYTQEGGQG